MVERIKHYTNAIAKPTIYKQYTWYDKSIAVARKHAAISYLAGNMLTVGKQVPSLIYYTSRTGYGYMAGSLMWCATHPKQVLEFVNQDPQMKHRAIERELEEWKRADRPGYERFIARVGKVGFFLIRTFDKMVTTIGYVAMYTKCIDKGYSDQRARQEALNMTLRTQPAAHAKDISEIYRTHESLNALLQFSNQLNKIWNMAAYDIPALIHNKKIHIAALELTSIVMGQIFIWSLGHRRLPEDWDDIKEALSEGALSMIPVIGRMILATRQGWSAMPAILRPIEAIGTALSTNASTKRKLNALVEGGAVGMGLPYIGVKRVVKTLIEEDLSEMVGGPPRK